MAPLEVAGPSEDVATLPPLENGGADLSVHLHVACEGAVRVVPDLLGHHYLPNLYIYQIVL